MSTIFRKMFASYKKALNRYPLTVQSFQSAFLLGAGDIIAQRIIDKNKDYEVMRTLRFTLLGAGMGPGLYIWYLVLERFIGDKSSVSSGTSVQSKFDKKALVKVAVDQGVFAPIFLSMFITCNTLLEGKGVDGVKSRLKNDYPDILFANYKVWPAVQVFNFGLVPLQYRVLFLQTVALAWNTYLAWRLNLSQEQKEKK